MDIDFFKRENHMRTLKKQIKQTKSRTRPITTGNNLMVAKGGAGEDEQNG